MMTTVLVLAACGMTAAATSGDQMGEQRNLIDFRTADRDKWIVVNDGVMGGVSTSDIRRTDQSTAVFAGVLSLENNGGFASVRVAVEWDLSVYTGLEVRVRGDGRTYQLRLRTDDGLDGISYKAHFATRDGEWTTTRIPFDQFVPTFRGRTPDNAPPLDTSHIRQLGFLLADKKPGTFSLEIDFVRTWTSDTDEP